MRYKNRSVREYPDETSRLVVNRVAGRSRFRISRTAMRESEPHRKGSGSGSTAARDCRVGLKVSYYGHITDSQQEDK